MFKSVEKPVNVVMGLRSGWISVAELAAMGVRRISVGSSLSRAALTGFMSAAREMKEHGTFTFAESAISYADVNKFMREHVEPREGSREAQPTVLRRWTRGRRQRVRRRDRVRRSRQSTTSRFASTSWIRHSRS